MRLGEQPASPSPPGRLCARHVEDVVTVPGYPVDVDACAGLAVPMHWACPSGGRDCAEAWIERGDAEAALRWLAGEHARLQRVAVTVALLALAATALALVSLLVW